MAPRYLFGPVTANFAEQNLKPQRTGGDCLAFDPAGTTDLAIRPGDSWEAVCGRLPGGWRPDFIVLYLPYTTIPECLWMAPVPLVGLAADWNLLWHGYRRLRSCELVLTDPAGVEAFQRAGIDHARAANLFGYERGLPDEAGPGNSRDVDLLFVGNLHPAVQRERLPWLGRLARLGERWNVCIRTGVFGQEYRELLGRSRIVFNRSVRGEGNRRVFEAACAGALLFQEQGNREVPAYFRDRQECVYYDADNLEALLEYYLEHEDERRARAEAARAKVPAFSFEKLWEDHLRLIASEWEGMLERARQRSGLDKVDGLLARTWQALGSSDGPDPGLARDLAAALVAQPQSASLHNALGLAVALAARQRGPVTEAVAQQASGYFERAVAYDPGHVVAGLNLLEALVGVRRVPQAIEQARRTLAVLDRQTTLDPRVLDSGHFPPAFDDFQVEWERAGWLHAGRPEGEARAKRDLLRWRLHLILGELTGSLAPYYEAALARPDLPVTHAALGRMLARANQPAEAVIPLRRALAGNPFDLEAARGLFQALGAAGDGEGQRRLARERRLLHRAARQVVPAEDWFLKVPPVGDELASILILCCNEVAYTRLCLESVLRCTRPPYELILVDNGSRDETPAYLEEVRARAGSPGGPARVEVIRNQSNRGFPAGCNQALARARGRYVVFLNNDTVVTRAWLDGLVRWALYDWPHVGMVGAVTNEAPPPQQVPAGYPDLNRLEAFAARRRQEFGGKALRAERVSGFCLLARREVLDQVGGFDERFGVGFFDDDDLGVRVRRAGFQTLVAQDVFIHHFGSRTFTALGIDCVKQLQANRERFKAKWGEELAARYRLPEDGDGAEGRRQKAEGGRQKAGVSQEIGVQRTPEAGSVAEAGAVTGPSSLTPDPSPLTPTVSLVMMVKDEEENLAACLESVAELFPDIVVVDTGSTDRTREVAERFGARVVEFPWVDSFAAARNEGLRHARGRWAFWLDADDRVDPENRAKLAELFAKLTDEMVAYSMKCRCLEAEDGTGETVVDHVRLFPVHPELRWEFRVHEQILPALRRLGGQVRGADVVIHHTGYVDPALRRRKRERDLRLLQMEEQEKPGHPFTLFNLGSIYQELGHTGEALAYFQRSLAGSHPDDSIVRKLYALIAQCQLKLGMPQGALAACRQGRGYYPDDLELLFEEGLARLLLRDLAGAEACLLGALGTREKGHFASVNVGLRGFKTRHQLAVVYQEQGREAEAEAAWRAALQEHPGFLPSWLALGELLLGQGRWDEVEQIADRLDGQRQGQAVGAVLRARLRMACGDYPAARQLLEEAVARAPGEVLLWLMLSRVLLQQGQDWEAAEGALRMVLELDPGNAETRGNLAVLLHQQGRGAETAAAVQGPTLAGLYHRVCTHPSDINEHCPTLYGLARECRHVTEFGTRTGNSTVALLYAQPDKLVCYDTVRFPQMDLLGRLAGRTQLVFVQADVLRVEIEPTDLLFIDTRHDYEQLREELRLHAGRVRRYIVLHDTTTFGERGETPGHIGLWPAVEEFLAQGNFRLKSREHHNHGLTVLEAVGP